MHGRPTCLRRCLGAGRLGPLRCWLKRLGVSARGSLLRCRGASEVLVEGSWGVSRGELLRCRLEPPRCRLAGAGGREAQHAQPHLSCAVACAVSCGMSGCRGCTNLATCFTGRTPTPHPTPRCLAVPSLPHPCLPAASKRPAPSAAAARRAAAGGAPTCCKRG